MIAAALPRERANNLGKYLDQMTEFNPDQTKILVSVDDIRDLLKANVQLLDHMETRQGQSNIRDHAIHELKLVEALAASDDANHSDKSNDIMDSYQNAVHDGVMDLVEVFISQGHSGMSAGWTQQLFMKLTNFEALSPLTDNPAEWNEVGENSWQNKRQSNAFSWDGGKHYYILNDDRGIIMKLPFKIRHFILTKLGLSEGIKARLRYKKIYKTQPSRIGWARKGQ